MAADHRLSPHVELRRCKDETRGGAIMSMFMLDIEHHPFHALTFFRNRFSSEAVKLGSKQIKVFLII